MERTVLVLPRRHVAENDAVAVQQVLERPQAHVVQVCVQAAVFQKIHVAQCVQTVDRHGELAEHDVKPRELVAHETRVVRVGPEHLRPRVEALAPRARVAPEARRQCGRLPAVMQEASARRAASRVDEGLELVVREERRRAARPAGRVVIGERVGSPGFGSVGTIRGSVLRGIGGPRGLFSQLAQSWVRELVRLLLVIRLVRLVRRHLLIVHVVGSLFLDPQELVREQENAKNGQGSQKVYPSTTHKSESRCR